jgi:hypothetical protein
MSKYTFELRKLFDFYTRNTVEGWFKDYNLSDYLTDEEIAVITARGTWTKDKLATKIVDHYLMREIGFETPYLFQHYVKITMKEIMEKKLPLIYSASIEYDPLVNVDYTKTFTRAINNTLNSTDNNSGITINSTTPQGEISKANILDGKYATSTQGGESTNQSATAGNTQEASTETTKGNSGVSATAQKMIQQYRENIIAIDTDIINELNDLFMGLY